MIENMIVAHPHETWEGFGVFCWWFVAYCVVAYMYAASKNPRIPKLSLRLIVHWLCIPVHWVSHKIHIRIPWLTNRRVTHIVIGIGLSYIGSLIAHHAEHTQYPVLVDTGAYTLHGLGAAPIIKAVADVLKFEI